MQDNIIIKKGEKIAIKCNFGYFLLQAKDEISQHRINNIKSSNLFESIEIFKGIKPDELPSQSINMSIYSYCTINEYKIKAKYDSFFSLSSFCEAFYFDKRKKKSVEFQKDYLLTIINKMSFDDFNKISIKYMREFAKHFPKINNL